MIASRYRVHEHQLKIEAATLHQHPLPVVAAIRAVNLCSTTSFLVAVAKVAQKLKSVWLAERLWCKLADCCFQVFAKTPIFQRVSFAGKRFDNNGMRRTELAFKFPLELIELCIVANVPGPGGMAVARPSTSSGENGWVCWVESNAVFGPVKRLDAHFSVNVPDLGSTVVGGGHIIARSSEEAWVCWVESNAGHVGVSPNP